MCRRAVLQLTMAVGIICTLPAPQRVQISAVMLLWCAQARRLQRKVAEGGDLGLDDESAAPPARAALQMLQAPRGRRRAAGGNPNPSGLHSGSAARAKRKADAGLNSEGGMGPVMLGAVPARAILHTNMCHSTEVGCRSDDEP